MIFAILFLMSGHRSQLRLSTSSYNLEFESVWLKKLLKRANKSCQKRGFLSTLGGRVYLFGSTLYGSLSEQKCLLPYSPEEFGVSAKTTAVITFSLNFLGNFWVCNNMPFSELN